MPNRPLTDFIAEVKQQGLSRTNRFSVEFALPPSVQTRSAGGANLEKILLFCDSASLPGMSLATTQSRTFGEFRDIAYEKLFEDVNMTFYVDTAMNVKMLFEDWMASIIDPVTRNMNYYKNYITDVTLHVYDVNNGERFKVTLYEAYPKQIGALALDYASRDIMKLSIAWVYKYYRVEQVQPVDTPDPFANRFTFSINNGQRIPVDYFNDFKTFEGKYNDFTNRFQNGGLASALEGTFGQGVTEIDTL